MPGRTPRHTVEIWPTAVGAWSAEDWPTLEPWLYAVDLFNHGYWWECHEVLETLWHAAHRTTPRARFVQGVIHVAAAYLNRLRGHRTTARRQAERGLARLEAGRRLGIHMGFDVPDFAARVRASLAEDAPPALLALERPPASPAD